MPPKLKWIVEDLKTGLVISLLYSVLIRQGDHILSFYLKRGFGGNPIATPSEGRTKFGYLRKIQRDSLQMISV